MGAGGERELKLVQSGIFHLKEEFKHVDNLSDFLPITHLSLREGGAQGALPTVPGGVLVPLGLRYLLCTVQQCICHLSLVTACPASVHR